MFMPILVFQVLKSLVVRGTAYSVGRPVFWWSQSGLYATALGSESVYLWCDPVTWPEKLNCHHCETNFPDVEEYSGPW